MNSFMFEGVEHNVRGMFGQTGWRCEWCPCAVSSGIQL